MHYITNEHKNLRMEKEYLDENYNVCITGRRSAGSGIENNSNV